MNAYFFLRQTIICIVLFIQASRGHSEGTIPTNTFQNSLAYRSAALGRMVQEASWFGKQLKLSATLPIQADEIDQKYYIRPPRTGFGGVFRTTNYLFRFSSKLDQIINREKHEERFDLYPIWAKTPSLIDTNGAYQLATQWLAAVSVDVPALQKKHPLSFYQWFVWGPEVYPLNNWKTNPPDSMKVMMPIFDVKWGDKGSPAVKVTVFGPTKELIVFEMNDISFSKRPPIVITNYEELLNIPDPPQKHLIVPSPMATTNVPTPQIITNRPAPFRRRVEGN